MTFPPHLEIRASLERGIGTNGAEHKPSESLVKKAQELEAAVCDFNRSWLAVHRDPFVLLSPSERAEASDGR